MANVDFRAGVVAVVRRRDGRVLAFERRGRPGAWQLPQGGMDPGETPLVSAWRELGEETGLGPREVRLVDEHPGWVAQEWPADLVASARHRRLGQVHRWFTFEVLDDTVEPVPDGDEFDAWRWVEVSWLLETVVGWRRPAYTQVLG
jgi:putative (di)nucleoside polyphosphate hydrolase